MNHLLVIVGPTAVGKTSFCIQLAREFKTEIISADSRQFFRELEIGTAKPSDKELAEAKHHFINSHSINDEFSAGSYEKAALSCISNRFEDKRILILTGGSGLYIQAVTEGMSVMPKIDKEVRDELNLKLQEHGLMTLVDELAEVDPEYHQKVDKDNPQRVIRALEVYRSSGNKYSEYRKKASVKRPFNVIKIGLDRPREQLYARINLRMDQMLDEGLVEEVKSLYDYKDHNALQTVGYKEVFDYLDGFYDHDEMVRLLKRNSRRYAKRQMTWFRRDQDIIWFHPDDIAQVIKHVNSLTRDP
ncbi:MAG: tRNA (adenosine(37)-N6)-dimethylallyltransferase MiaA [Bacteroidota bacterium]